MKHVIRKLTTNWKVRKFFTLLLVFIIVIIGSRLSKNEADKDEEAIEARAYDASSELEDMYADRQLIYQYPVELGYPVAYNHNGSDSIDYLKKTYKTVEGNARTEEQEDVRAGSTMKLVDDNCRKLHTSFGDILCINSGELDFSFNNVDSGSGYDKATIMYADKTGYIIDDFGAARYNIDNNFYGKLTYNCVDGSGNTSSLVSQYLLIENSVPGIQISEGDIYDSPNSVNVEVTDGGKIISGIYAESIQCLINGNEYTPDDVKSVKSCRLADNLEVSTDTLFSIQFPKDGSYDVEISVSDNCGNTASFKYFISIVNNKVVIS